MGVRGGWSRGKEFSLSLVEEGSSSSSLKFMGTRRVCFVVVVGGMGVVVF